MTFILEKALKKLDRPPSGHNWVRLVRDSKPATSRAIMVFVKGLPKFTYQSGSVALRDKFLFGIGLDAAVSLVRRSGAPAGRLQNEELVKAFFEHDAARHYPIGTCIEFERQWFRVSRELLVPVSPLVVFREHGNFVPIFLCGWTDLALDLAQRRLLMTIYEDAFLSLTDFQHSPAEFLFFPKVDHLEGRKRQPEIWMRGDYDLLSQNDLAEQVRIYTEGRAEARTLLIEEARKQTPKEEDRPQRNAGDDLFGFDPDKDNNR